MNKFHILLYFQLSKVKSVIRCILWAFRWTWINWSSNCLGSSSQRLSSWSFQCTSQIFISWSYSDILNDSQFKFFLSWRVKSTAPLYKQHYPELLDIAVLCIDHAGLAGVQFSPFWSVAFSFKMASVRSHIVFEINIHEAFFFVELLDN